MESLFQSFAAAAGGVKMISAGTAFALLFIGERVMRAATPPKSRARLFRNLGLWAIILVLSPLIVTPITAMGANHLLWRRPDGLGAGLFMVAIDIALLDLWTYWAHRAWHVVPVMWRFHRVHHLDEFLDTTSAFRFHIGEVVISAALRLVPVMLFAIPFAHVAAFETVFICAVLFHHSNLGLPPGVERALSRIIVTPSIHWVHHHAVMKDTHSNYSTIFSLWDRLFHSRSLTQRTPAMKIGLESIEDAPFFRLLLTPFLRSLK